MAKTGAVLDYVSNHIYLNIFRQIEGAITWHNLPAEDQDKTSAVLGYVSYHITLNIYRQI